MHFFSSKIKKCVGNGTDTPASSQDGHNSSGESSISHEADIEQGLESQNSQGSETKGSVSSQSQSQTGSTQSTQSTQPLSQFRGSHMSSRLRAHAFITLGEIFNTT